ncbi:MAG: DUF6314 family protein [Chlamydiales bacterium]
MLLRGLFGSKSIERILLFLLDNERAYASQLHRILQTPLTPLQKGLNRLEREGILKSSYDGKIRYYSFNPEYFLLDELEALLKKVYIKLSPSEKKKYYYVRYIPQPNRGLLEEVWKKLQMTREVIFQFYSRKSKGVGKGLVTISYHGDIHCIFHERGSWQSNNHQEFNFRNVFRWTLNRFEGLLTLEHLRFGEKHPVFLFHLTPVNENTLESLHTHVCGKDTYFGKMTLLPPNLELIWRILGPKKNDKIRYTYQ